MPDRFRIAYYVTSHGYGHLNRAAAVVEALPEHVTVVVKTHRDLFDRWRESVGRPCELLEGVFDCGAVHPPGESSRVDPQATLERYAQVHAVGVEGLAHEVTYLRDGPFDAVVCDVAPLPLRAAKMAGIPGLLVANFTWSDIFRPYARRCPGVFSQLLHEMQEEYAQANVLLRAEPALPPNGIARVREVGLVTRRGRNRRSELLTELRLPRHSRLVYLYVGRYGQDDMQWQNLTRLADLEFVTYHTLDLGLPNWHVVDPGRWPPRDLTASVDAMVAKAGYGTVTDAMTHRVPLVFPPRFGFAEHRVLAAGLRRWGGGVPISTREFKQLRLRTALETACHLRPAPPPWPCDGAQRCVREILRCARIPRSP